MSITCYVTQNCILHTKIITSLFGTRAPIILKKNYAILACRIFAIKNDTLMNTNNYRQLNYFFIQSSSYKLWI